MVKWIKLVSSFIFQNLLDFIIVLGTIDGFNFLFEKNDTLLHVKESISFSITKWHIVILLGIILLKNIIKMINNTNIGKDNHIYLRTGDIFKQERKSLKVIPFDNKFTLTLKRNGISPNSLQGKFINKLSSKEKERIKKKIDQSLKIQNIMSNNNCEYPIGSSVIISIKGSKYILFALSSLKEDNTICSSSAEYYAAVSFLVKFIEKNNRDYKTILPLIGNGLSRLNLSDVELIESLISIIKMSSSKGFKGDIIILVSKKTWIDYSFNN